MVKQIIHYCCSKRSVALTTLFLATQQINITSHATPNSMRSVHISAPSTVTSHFRHVTCRPGTSWPVPMSDATWFRQPSLSSRSPLPCPAVLHPSGLPAALCAAAAGTSQEALCTRPPRLPIGGLYGKQRRRQGAGHARSRSARCAGDGHTLCGRGSRVVLEGACTVDSG